MSKHRIVHAFLLALSFCFLINAYASKVPQNGHDWRSMPKSEKVAFCAMSIYGMVGVDVYPSKKIELAAQYFAGRINYYYETHSLDNPIAEAQAWAWPETKKLLDNF